VATLLLEKGANENAQNRHKQTAGSLGLTAAVEAKHDDDLRKLGAMCAMTHAYV